MAKQKKLVPSAVAIPCCNCHSETIRTRRTREFWVSDASKDGNLKNYSREPTKARCGALSVELPSVAIAVALVS